MNGFDFLSGPTGGLSYHLSALRYRRTLWAPFTAEVARWLDAWRPETDELIIFGTSAGWTIPPELLQRFSRVLAVEPDPVARAIFKSRFSGKAKRLELSGDPSLLPWLARESERENRFADFLRARPRSAILFTNVLGQIPLLAESAQNRDGERAKAKFRAGLEGRAWASYHDLFSSKARLKAQTPDRVPAGLSIAELAAKFYVPQENQPDVIEHDTLWISQGRPLQTAIWRLRPAHAHVIGFVHT